VTREKSRFLVVALRSTPRNDIIRKREAERKKAAEAALT